MAKLRSLILYLLIIATGVAIYYMVNDNFEPDDLHSEAPKAQKAIEAQVATPTPTAPLEATPVSGAEQNPCTQKLQELSSLRPLSELKSTHQDELRMHNLHLRYDGEIYRLRQFYDDGDEGERLTYLVYIEDSDEFASIIERSPYKKGAKYLKLEQSYRRGGAKLLFEELAYSVDGLYLHYRNGKLVHAAGTLNDSHLECAL